MIFNRNKDQRYYKKMAKIIPELASYKDATIMHIQDRAAEVGVSDLQSYYEYLKTNEEEQQFLKKNLTKLGSHFFRGEDWEFFKTSCLSQFAGKKDIRIWCAGCSSGQEVYSTLMSILDYVDINDVSVLATDYNDDLLAKCADASYFNMHYHEVPEKYQKYVDKGEKKFVMKPELKSVVTTKHLNLLTDEYPKDVDIIICRNVLKFFSMDVIDSIHVRFADSLRSGGFLFVSADEDEKNKHSEFVRNPEKLGMSQVEDRSIFRKN